MNRCMFASLLLIVSGLLIILYGVLLVFIIDGGLLEYGRTAILSAVLIVIGIIILLMGIVVACICCDGKYCAETANSLNNAYTG